MLQTFEGGVLECVDRTTREIFGESSRWALMWHLENDWGLKREEIPRKPEAFEEALRRLFGVGADLVLERLAGALCSEFQLTGKEVRSFTEAVKLARASKAR